MEDYKKLYHKMFNKVTDVIEELKKLQQEAEEEYLGMTEKETKLKLVKKVKNKEE